MKKIALVLIISFSLFLTGCIELVEKVHVNKDGSGTFELYLDMGNFLSMLQNSENVDFLEKISNDESVEEIGNIKGISNVSVKSKDNSKPFYLKFDFENTKALNNALYAFFMDDEPFIKPNIISVNKNRVKQRNITPYIVKQLDENSEDLNLDEILEHIDCKIIVTSDEDIKSAKGDKIKIEENNKAEVAVSLQDLLEYEPDVSFKVKY